jgi:hypothetical protein
MVLKLSLVVLGTLSFLPSFTQTLNEEIERENVIRRDLVQLYLQRHPEDRVIQDEKLLYDISPFGKPIFKSHHSNRIAAATLGTNYLKEGGLSLFDLEGTQFHIGVWEAGFPNTFHPEFGNRVVQKDQSSYSQGDHATHVIGTIGASGLNPEAKGMASQVFVNSYDVIDDNIEMANAARDGLLISNHSYGLLSGWDDGSWYGDVQISTTEDWKFGFYSSDARIWDAIAYDNPYYLIVKSAGNDRGDSGPGRPSDGPYDCISDTGNAKNVMTVGAVLGLSQPYTQPSQVVMSNFSSWGPTDDGRIKPDIVAMGVDVLSTTANNGYGSLQGTSMAAPNLSGSLILLQQLHTKLFGKPMLASTLKGLIIHTAHEAGDSPGPDYSFGWGLANVRQSAMVLKQGQNSILELQLENSKDTIIEISATPGAKVVATLSWTDPAGPVSVPSLDPVNLRLVNDLDMKIIRSDGVEYFPWILNPANPSAPATQGNNFRDNVEKVEFISEETTSYRIHITHKGSLLDGIQKFSLIITTGSLTENAPLEWVGTAGDNDLENPMNWRILNTSESPVQPPGKMDKVRFNVDNGSLSLSGSKMMFRSIHKNGPGSLHLTFSDSLTITDDLMVKGGPVFLQPDFLEMNGTSNALVEGELHVTAPVLWNNGFWNVNQSTLFTDTCAIKSGSIRIENSTISATAFESYTPVSVLHSKIISSGDVLIRDDNSVFEHTDLIINSNQACRLDIKSNNSEFRTIDLSGNVSVECNLNSKAVDVNGQIDFHGTLKVDSLVWFSNSILNFSQDSVSVAKHLSRMGPAEVPIVINGSGTILHSDAPAKFCLDYLNVTGLKARGNALFNAGENSMLVDSDGWQHKACEDVLFADFRVAYPCPNGLSELISQSSGDPESLVWEIAQPVKTFEGASVFFSLPQGNYMATLTIRKGGEQHTSTKPIAINNSMGSTLRKPVLSLQGEVIRVTNFSPSYTWFYEGDTIPEANSSMLTMTTSGSYYVITRDNFCRFSSDTIQHVVTGLMQEDEEMITIVPNPASNYIEVLGLKDSDEVTVHDLMGRQLNHKNPQLNKSLTFTLDGYSRGLYFVQVNRDSNIIVKRFVIK